MALGKVRVPQQDGEVRVAVGGDDARTWKVQDGLVSPSNSAERDLLLRYVDGAKPAPADKKE